jgi:large subunit ribosomal protein L21
MYAIFSDRGKQICAKPGEKVLIDLQSAEPGSEIEFDQVLMIGGEEATVTVGKPVVSGAKVVASVIGHVRGKKIEVGTYKRRKNFKRKKGHRQDYTQVKIKDIVTG